MKHTQYKKSRFTSFLTGKGFYIAIAVSVIVVAVTAFFAINAKRNDIVGQNSNNLSSNLGTSSGLEVHEPQSDVPMESTSSSSASESESEQEANVATQPQNNDSAVEEQRSFSNTFVMPLNGNIINEFSDGELVKSKTLKEWRTHDGIDIAADIATPVKSSSDGIVISITQDPQWGVVVVIDHGNGYESYYMGLNVNVNVAVEDVVDIGTVIGSVGQTAEIEVGEEAHLHFAIKKDGIWIDPMTLMKTA